jgi:hypothetical protein
MRKEIDWDGIEPHFRANVRSLRDIAAEFGTTHTSIRKKATELGWTRDLQGKIKARYLHLVSKAALSNVVSIEKAATEQQIVEANADLQKNLILSHRADIRAARSVAVGLLDELRELGEHRIDFMQLGEQMADPEKPGRDRKAEQFQAVVSFAGRVDCTKKLTESFKTLIGLEREAFGIESRHSIESEESLQNLKITFVPA